MDSGVILFIEGKNFHFFLKVLKFIFRLSQIICTFVNNGLKRIGLRVLTSPKPVKIKNELLAKFFGKSDLKK